MYPTTVGRPVVPLLAWTRTTSSRHSSRTSQGRFAPGELLGGRYRIIAMLGKGVDKVIIALVTVQWAYYARTVRGTALSEMNKEYVEAARCLGFSHTRIVFKQILPNCLPPLIVVATIQAAHAITLEATLSFLGVGLPSSTMSWGNDISAAQTDLRTAPQVLILPSVALSITVLSFIMLGEVIRDALDPKARAQR